MTKDSPAVKFVMRAWVQAGFAGLLVLAMAIAIWYQAREASCREQAITAERAFFVDLQLKQYDRERARADQLVKLLENNTAAFNGVVNAVQSLDRSINELRSAINQRDVSGRN